MRIVFKSLVGLSALVLGDAERLCSRSRAARRPALRHRRLMLRQRRAAIIRMLRWLLQRGRPC